MHSAGLTKSRRSGWPALLSQEGSAGPKGPREGWFPGKPSKDAASAPPSRDLA
jgi:hypothetical protein